MARISGLEKKPTQCDRILKYLHDFGSITSYEAFTDLGITQLAARLRNLEDDGYIFKKSMICKINRYGEKVHFKKYELVGDME